jgi:hypothetical protein
MNCLRLAIAILFAFCAQCSYADSIPTFHITEASMIMGPNDGEGDNVRFILTGPGVNITGVGGMACFDWCSGQPVPGDTVIFTTQIFITQFFSATIGGIKYNPDLLMFDSLFDDSGGLNALSSGYVGADVDFIQFNMTAPHNGSWSFDFEPVMDENGNLAYVFREAEFSASAPLPTPEPATVGLMLTGLAGIGAISKRRGKFRRPRNRGTGRTTSC